MVITKCHMSKQNDFPSWLSPHPSLSHYEGAIWTATAPGKVCIYWGETAALLGLIERRHGLSLEYFRCPLPLYGFSMYVCILAFLRCWCCCCFYVLLPLYHSLMCCMTMDYQSITDVKVFFSKSLQPPSFSLPLSLSLFLSLCLSLYSPLSKVWLWDGV